jgi:L-asparagine transporter-like permease
MRMRLTGRQIWICLGVGSIIGLGSFAGSAAKQGPVGLWAAIPYLLGCIIGGTLICMVVTMIINLVTRRKAKDD